MFLLEFPFNAVAYYIGSILLGLVFLYYGAEWLIDGASKIATRLGVSPLVVGLTIVSIGTSLPEFVVSILAVLENNSGIAVGNVVGSNIANIFIILGITYIIKAPNLPFSTLKFDYFIMLFSSVLLFVLGYWQALSSQTVTGGLLTRTHGGILLAVMVLYLIYLLKCGSNNEENSDESTAKINVLWLSFKVIAGLVCLFFGGKFLVYGATECAKLMNINDIVIGATVVAVGTSLPELFASTVAAAKGHPEIAIGNVIGSNLFNILLILGASGVIDKDGLELSAQCLVEQIPFFFLSALLLGLALAKKGGVGRFTGIFFVLIYVVFVLIAASVINLQPYYSSV
jgi:cation:H+ antiporter